MLLELSVRDFAIIESLSVSFEPGLNALTGATGAGKSIIIDALGAVLGERIGPDVVRGGAKAAIVEAHFDVSALISQPMVSASFDEHGIEPEDGVVILSREIHAGGRSIARINGRATTAGVLSQIGGMLVDIHGQSDHLSLLRPAFHIELLDRYAGLLDERAQIAQKVREWREIDQRLRDVLSGAREREQRIDLLSFQAREIAEAGLRTGEEEELATERSRLANAERLAEDADLAFSLLSGENEDGLPPALPLLQQAATRLADMAHVDTSTNDVASRLTEVVYLVQDISGEIRDYRDRIEADPERLEAVEERLDLIKKLRRKYGASIEDVIEFGERAQAELESLTGSDGDSGALAARADALLLEIGTLSEGLSAKRTIAGERMAREVEASIAELNMGRASFAVQITRSSDPDGVPVGGTRVAFDDHGIDRVEFMLAPNAGEPLKPLARVASGGETARLMLALKSILAAADSTPTLVFDEVDVGVGGRSGQVVGEKLWSLTDGHQVIVITHLSQIAAFADAHFRIQKLERDGRTVSAIERIEGAERVDEIAAMFDGIPATEESRAAARQLLERVRLWQEQHPLNSR